MQLYSPITLPIICALTIFFGAHKQNSCYSLLVGKEETEASCQPFHSDSSTKEAFRQPFHSNASTKVCQPSAKEVSRHTFNAYSSTTIESCQTFHSRCLLKETDGNLSQQKIGDMKKRNISVPSTAGKSLIWHFDLNWLFTYPSLWILKQII